MIRVMFEPVSKGRPRFTKSGHAFTPKKTREAEKELRQLLTPFSNPALGALQLSITFAVTRPKKPSKNYPSRADLDNYMKLFKDAANGILWEDDSQVVRYKNSEKIYAKPGEPGYIEFEIEKVTIPVDENK